MKQERSTSRSLAVSVRGLEKRFGSFVAVDRIDLDVREGEIFGFLGPNGAGKSTTIRMLCGILEPTGGNGRVAGCDIRAQTEQIKEHIGYMSQKFSLYNDLTVEENIDFYSGIYRVPRDRKAARKEWVLEMAGLRDLRAQLTSTLAGGMKQRLALGCAILHEPSLVFLDEPTAGVDPINRRRFWNLIHELAGQGMTVFVTSHYMDEVEYCGTIGLIYDGELIALGSPEQLKTRSMPGVLLELACDRPQDALVELHRLPEVQEAALFGSFLHVLTERRETAEPIRRELIRKGYAVTRVEPILPTMEDVFVTLIEAHDRKRSSASGGAA